MRMYQKSKTLKQMREDAREIFLSGVAAVEPGAAVDRYCRVADGQLYVADRTYDLKRFKNLFVLGGGKASAPMAAAIERLVGHRLTRGIVNVKYGHVADVASVKLVEAGHPVPDENGAAGSRAILELAASADEDDLVLCLMSGGGSSLLPLPADGLTLKDKQDTTEVLLSCGATIHEINAIRKHTSGIKGGRLAQAVYPATLVSLILSDVVGDDLDVIASGPTVPDSSRFADCMEIFDKYDIIKKLPPAVVDHIKRGVLGEVGETPKAGDPIFKRVQNVIVGSNIEAVLAAKKTAEKLGYNSLVLSSMIEGDTRNVAYVHAAIAREIIKTDHPLPPPACVLSGGETTVTLTGEGLGGRCQEFALAAAKDISRDRNIVILAAGTDGTDGPTDAAGAVVDSDTIERAIEKGLDPKAYLANNDAYHFFKKLNDLIITGPTNTNVMDLRIVLAA